MRRNSRVEQVNKKRYERNIFLALAGIIIVFLIFFFFGVPILVNLSLFAENLQNKDYEQILDKKDINYVAPPIINPLPIMTNQSKIDLSGSALPDQKVILFLNGEEYGERTIDEDSKFSFKKIPLKEGANKIRAKTVDKNKHESEFSNVVTVTLKKEPPKLDIEQPVDNQVFKSKNKITIKGKTDPGSRITINDFWAIVDSQGNFSYQLNIKDGENKIVITAIDEASNKEQKELTVKKE